MLRKVLLASGVIATLGVNSCKSDVDDNASREAYATAAKPRDKVDVPDKTVVVTMSWSDTRKNQRALFKLFETYPFLRSTFYVNSPRVGKSGSLSLADLKKFQEMGQEIGGHTLNHDDLTQLSRDEALKEVCDDRKALMQMGFAMTSFGYPSSSHSTDAAKVVEDCGYNNARETGSLDEGKQESIPPKFTYDIRLDGSYKYRQHDLGYLKSQISEAQRAVRNGGKAWVMISFHDICQQGAPSGQKHADADDNCDRTYHANIKDLYDWAEWMKTQPNLMHLTAQEVMGGCSRPARSANEVKGGNPSPACSSALPGEGEGESPGEGGENLPFANWGPGQPNNSAGGEHCVAQLSNGTWSDVECSKVKNYACVDGGKWVISEAQGAFGEFAGKCPGESKFGAPQNMTDVNALKALQSEGPSVWINLTDAKKEGTFESL